MANSGKSAERSQRTEFPFRFLLRWAWPQHIEKLMRRLLWLWLSEAAGESTTEEFDRLGGYVCWLIAKHPETPAAVLDLLSKQKCEPFLERVAENPSTWPTTLTNLSKDRSPRVRAAVAENYNTPPQTVVDLADDESADVRYAVAENAHRPRAVLEALCADENCHVAARSQKTLGKLAEPEVPARLPGVKTAKRANRAAAN